MTKQKIFFSYSRADGSAFALKLAVDLKKKGFDVWIDQQDIRAGMEWDTEIEKALESCDCVLFLETEKSVVSNNVLDEVYYALEQNKKVIPLIYVDSRTPFRLNRLQHLDFTKNYDTGLALLVKELEGNTPAVTYLPEEKPPLKAHNKPFYFRNYRALVIIACIAVLITAVVVLFAKNKSEQITQNKAGDWTLMDIEPKAQSQQGYLKIEAFGENKVTIKSYMQFYYPDSKASSYLTIFNAFAGCTSCAVNKEMKLNVEDIAVGSRTIKKLQEDQPDGRKAGDVILDANFNKSIRGTVTLQFLDNNNAVIKVKQPLTLALANGLMLEPFVYTFRFKKND